MSTYDPFAERKKEMEDAAKQRLAQEETYLRDLMDAPAGKWLLGQIIVDFERELARKTTGHNSDDCYHRGIQDNAKKYRDLVVKHFGHAGIDRITKGS